MVSKNQDYWEQLRELYPRKYPDERKVTTDCLTIDNMAGGGIPRGKVTGFMGATMGGKTWIAFQLAAKFCVDHPGETVLYIDTEAFWDEEEIELFFSFYRERWGLPKDFVFRILFVRKLDIYSLFEYFGMIADIDQTGKKITASVTFLRDKIVEKVKTDKLGRERKVKVKQGKHAHILLSDGYKFIKKNKVGMVIVDSLTQPIKEIFSTSRQQDFPARANVINPILGTLRALAIVEDIPVITTLHLTFSSIQYASEEKGSKPWGGMDIIYHIKVILGILNPINEEKSPFKEDGEYVRKILRFRVPGMLRTSELVYLWPNTGFIDVIKQSGTDGKG